MLLLGALFRFLWIYAAEPLVETQNRKAQVAFVLEGQFPTNWRTDAARKALAAHQVDRVVISGNYMFGDTLSTAEAYRDDMVRRGADPKQLILFRHYATSTIQEARLAISGLRQLGVDTIALITSSYHTARATRIFNAVSGGKPYFYALDVQVPDFDPQQWQEYREMRAIVPLEWTKTLLTAWELAPWQDLSPLPTRPGDWRP